MLTCIARSKQRSMAAAYDNDLENSKNQSVKSLSSELKDMAPKASGAYRGCGLCVGTGADPGTHESDRFRWLYRQQGSSGSSATSSACQKRGMISD